MGLSQTLARQDHLLCNTPNCKNKISLISVRSGKKEFCDYCIRNHKRDGWNKRYARKKRNAWQSMYDFARYHTDEAFRRNRIKNSIKWQKEHKEEYNEYQKELYSKRTPEQIQKRKEYLKNLRSKRNGILC